MSKTERSSNFELMRLFLILFVIILHFNNPSRDGAFCYIENAPFSNKCFLFLMESLTICAVNTFVLLSGYFMIRKSTSNIRKVIDLFLTLVMYKFFICVGSEIYHSDFSIHKLLAALIPSNYYAWLYSTVFLLSPFLNILIGKLDKQYLHQFMIIIMILFSVIPTVIDYLGITLNIEVGNMSTISMNGNGKGFTLVNFILCYYVGGYLARISDCNNNILAQGKALIVYILSSLIIFFGLFINRHHALDYCNIFVIIQSAAFFLIFKNLKIKKIEFINYLAKSVWGIFVLHGYFLGIYSKIDNVEDVTTGGFGQLVLHFLLCIIASFILSLILDKIFSICLKPMHYVMDKIALFNKTISTE